MNRVTATILSLALAASVGWAADPPEKKEVPLPVPVVKAEEAMETAVNRALAIYLKTVEAEVKKMQAALEKAKQDATKAGNLEIAMAIKAKQDALTVDAVVAKGAESGGDLLGEGKPDLAKMIVGKWDRSDNTECDFRANGTGSIGSIPVKWSVVKETVCITFPNQPSWFMRLKQSDNGFDGLLDDGRSITLTRKAK